MAINTYNGWYGPDRLADLASDRMARAAATSR